MKQTFTRQTFSAVLTRRILIILLLTVVLAVVASCSRGEGAGNVGADGTGMATADDTSSADDSTPNDPAATDTETQGETFFTGTTLPETTATEAETSFTLPDPTLTPAVDMPRVDITTEGGADITDRENYLRATVSLSRCDEAYTFENSLAGIRVRGNSTAGQVKKPYRIKFDTKQSFLDLNGGAACKSWCLMADYFDPSFLRTWVTFEMAASLLEGRYYSSDCAPVEVYINGDYHGVYLLCEQTQVNRHRVDIDEKEDGETSVEVGYLLIGQGGRSDEPESIRVSPGITVTDRLGSSAYYGDLNFALSGGGYTAEQKAYVSAYVAGVYRVINGALSHEYYTLSRDGQLSVKTDFVGKTPSEKQRETIAAVFDVEAAVRMCILDELVKNLDASTFNMYVDLSPGGDGRLTLAAPWDFDFALGNCRHENLCNANDFYATLLTVSGNAGLRVNPLYVMLIQMDWFEAMVRDVWQAHVNDIRLAVNGVMVNAYRYADAYGRDYDRWGLPISHFNWDHHDREQLASFKQHMDAATALNRWLVERVDWLDRQWGTAAVEPADRQPLLEVDMTDPAAAAYTGGAHGCRLDFGADGLTMTVTNQIDPYFYITFDGLGERFDAIDYPILEITYRIPASDVGQTLGMEIFLCAGQVSNARAGLSVTFACRDERDVTVTCRLDLRETGYWFGDIHKIRIDLDGSRNGDVLLLTSVRLLPQ